MRPVGLPIDDEPPEQRRGLAQLRNLAGQFVGPADSCVRLTLSIQGLVGQVMGAEKAGDATKESMPQSAICTSRSIFGNSKVKSGKNPP